MLSILLLFLSVSIGILWTIPFIVLKVFGLHLHRVTNKNRVIRFLSTVKGNSTITVDGDKPNGFLYGMWYFAYIHETTDQNSGKVTEIYLLSTNKIFKTLSGESEANTKLGAAEKKIMIYNRGTCFFRLDYTKRSLDVTKFIPKENQKSIMDNILTHFKKNQHTVVYIYGKPGSGKSMIGLLLAKELSASYCKEWNPTDPGDSLSQAYNAMNPSLENPLVLVLDEFDVIITKFIGGITPHKFFAIPVNDKTTWNQMLDNINLGMYPHLILLLTSNKSQQWVDEEDPSLTRKGRVDLSIEL